MSHMIAARCDKFLANRNECVQARLEEQAAPAVGIFHDSKPWLLGSQSGSDVSFGKNDVLSRLEQICTTEDPSELLKSMCSSYDILDLADSEDDVFEQGMKHLLTAACTAQPATHPHFRKTFILIASAVEGKQMHLQSALDSFLQTNFQPCAMDLSGVLPLSPHTVVLSVTWMWKTNHRIRSNFSPVLPFRV